MSKPDDVVAALAHIKREMCRAWFDIFPLAGACQQEDPEHIKLVRLMRSAIRLTDLANKQARIENEQFFAKAAVNQVIVKTAIDEITTNIPIHPGIMSQLIDPFISYNLMPSKFFRHPWQSALACITSEVFVDQKAHRIPDIKKRLRSIQAELVKTEGLTW